MGNEDKIRELEAEVQRLRQQREWILQEFRLCRLCVYHERECWPYQANCTPELDEEALP